jgi:UDP-glucose/iron transport system permease protein
VLNGLDLHQLTTGLLQAALAAAAAIAVAFAARARGIDLIRETLVSISRGICQIVAVGLILVVLLRGPWWTSPILLAFMIAAAAKTSAYRARKFPGALRLSLYSIAIGAGGVIALMTAAGAIERTVAVMVPVGSMLIANAMNANALALERFRSDVEAHVGEIETALALGAAPPATTMPYVRAALRASLIPSVNNLRSLGIVWIPGVMAGMVLSGSPPLYAALYQFVVMAMIFAASGLTCLISTWFMTTHAFSKAEQLLLAPAMENA